MRERVARLVILPGRWRRGKKVADWKANLVAKQPMVFESLLTSTLTSTGISKPLRETEM
jgi:hypothetical protein